MTIEHDSDFESFEQIVAAHEAAVRAFIAVRLSDPFEAHDLAQDVFLLLWRKLGQIDLSQPLRPWLLTVATNLIRQHRRKGRAVPVGGNDAILDLLQSRLEGRAAIRGPAFDALENCLGKLDDAARHLIQLRYKDELGIREIGNQTGSQHSTITMKLYRLRSLLFDCIQARMQEASL